MQTPQRIPYDGLASLPPDVGLVWHGVNDAANLRQFLSADVPWGELDVNVDPVGQELILRHDSFADLPRWDDEKFLFLRDALPHLVETGKSIKLDFKAGGTWIEAALEMVDRTRPLEERLWLNADLDILGESGIRDLSARYPAAIVQVPLHSLHSRLDAPQEIAVEVEQVAAWGVNRFSVGWRYPDVAGIVARLKVSGYGFNIYGVANLQQFIQAVDMRPDSVTADFNFPEWCYYGRGSGHGGRFYTYSVAVSQR